MPIPVLHTIRMTKIATTDSQAAPFRVLCSCQWEGRAHTRNIADKWVNSHTYAQLMRGNNVIIELDTSVDPPITPYIGEQKPSKVDADE